MDRPSVSIVIPVWNEWQHTRNCLETLRPTLGLHDEVIVVDNGSEDETPRGLHHYPWAQVITNETNRGFAKACNQGAAVAVNDVVIFLNNDTVLPARWIEGLVWPFDNTAIVATGPRSNSVSGPQVTFDATYAMSPMSSFRTWARDWRDTHRGLTTPVDRLVGFCLAVRRHTFEVVGGFDEQFGIGGFEDDDLCRRLGEHGTLLICHESFVHHVGHATFDGNNLDWFAIQNENDAKFREKHGLAARVDETKPLLSACMIVKDEIDNLDRCFTSLNGLVDEVVVYDTGSTDGSIELARAAGATVVEGYWDDDFSRARNAALAACSGEWILHIDADEEFVGDAATARGVLEQAAVRAFVVDIENVVENEVHNLTHHAARLFRRDFWHWEGRLHEQLQTNNGEGADQLFTMSDVHLRHYGYHQDAMVAKNKAERNVRIAQLQADSGTGDPVETLTNLGRSLSMANRHEEALVVYSQARTLRTDIPRVRRNLFRSGAFSCLSVGRPSEALAWLDELEAIAEGLDVVHYLRGIAFSDSEQHEAAVEQLVQVEDMNDPDGVQYPIWLRHVKLGHSYAALGRWAEAADVLAIAAVEESNDEPIWALVAESFYRAGQDVGPLMGRLPAKHMNAVFAQLLTTSPEAADNVLEAIFPSGLHRSSVMALSIRVAPNLRLERALEWSHRLREYSMGQECPVVKIANSERPALERLQAAVVVHAAFQDGRAFDAIRFTAPALEESTFEVALVDTSNLDPSLLASLITAAATTPTRCRAMAEALAMLGAPDEGAAVLMAGIELGADTDFATEAAKWLDAAGFAELATAARSRG